MDADTKDKPVIGGDDGREDIVSDESDTGEAIIELDQSHLGSPSDSFENGQFKSFQATPSIAQKETLYNNTADSEYFDAVSDTEDLPDDDDCNPSSETAKVATTVAELSLSKEPQAGKQVGDGSLSSGECAPAVVKGPIEGVTTGDGGSSGSGDANLPSKSDAKPSVPDAKTISCSPPAEETPKDTPLSQDSGPQQAAALNPPQVEIAPEKVSSSNLETPIEETSHNESALQDSTKSQEAVSSASEEAKPAEASIEAASTAPSLGALTEGAESVSDISSDEDVPMSDDEDKQEKLSQQAAKQAEALAPLGAEPVSEPESGEEVGSDESPPPTPGFGSLGRPGVRGGYGDLRDHLNRNAADRLSLEDNTGIPLGNTSDKKIDHSTSLDMENISDDENIGDDGVETDTSGEIIEESETKLAEEDTGAKSSTAAAQPEDSQNQRTENAAKSEEKASNDEEQSRRPTMIATLGDKQQVETHFNEEAVELDYEDVDGEGDGEGDGEIKGDDNEKEEGEDSDKDEGELDDDDDCEEGEIKEEGTPPKKQFVKPICRFYQRGQCTWGLNCRFLHPGVNDKGNYQMIEIPGMRWNGPGSLPAWSPEDQEEPVDLPPPPPEPPREETAWERGLRQAKEQMKKATQRKEHESNFEEKRLNLSVDEDREMNKENERRMVMHATYPKDPYYDQAEYDEEEYYKQPGRMNQWQGGQYENFEVRYTRDQSYSPGPGPGPGGPGPYRDKEYYRPPPPDRYPRHFSPPVDKFGRERRDDSRPDARPEPPYRGGNQRAGGDPRAASPTSPGPAATAPNRRPDEWHDPWQRSKSPKAGNRRGRSRSRSGRGQRSLSHSTFSSGSRSRSGSSDSRSSISGSSFSSRSGSRSPEPAPPGVDRGDRNYGPGGQQPGRYMDGPRSAVAVRGRGGGGDRGYHGRGGGGPGGYNNYNNRGGYHHHRGQHQHQHQHRRQYGQQPQQQGPPERSFPPGYGYNRPPAGRGRPNERRIPPDALRPHRKSHSGSSSGSSRSGSGSRSGSSSSYSRSGSRSGSSASRSKSRGSRSGSASSASSHSSGSSSSSSGSADSDNLYRDLGAPSPKKKVKDKTKEVGARGPRVPKVPQVPPPHPAGPPPPEHARAPGDRKRRSTDHMHHRRPSGGHAPPGPGHAPPPPGHPAAAAGRPPRPEGHPGHRPPGEGHPGHRPPPEGHPGHRPPGEGHPGHRPPEGHPGHRPPVDGHPGHRPSAADQPGRMGHPGRPERPGKPERPEFPDRHARPDRPDRPARPERGDRGADRAERERHAAMMAGRPHREQSSRPPPQAQAKAKDPMKLMGLKSNIKLSLVSKQQSERPTGPSSPMKRRPTEAGDGPPMKRPNMAPTSPIKMPSEKAVRPREPRVRSPSERQPRSGSGPLAASLPTMGAAASIPLPTSPIKLPSSKPHPPRAAHPPPPGKLGPPAGGAPPKAKKSTTSRREELLKQLKAVEDAIARKKAKMN